MFDCCNILIEDSASINVCCIVEDSASINVCCIILIEESFKAIAGLQDVRLIH